MQAKYIIAMDDELRRCSLRARSEPLFRHGPCLFLPAGCSLFLKLPTVASDPPSSNCMQQEGKFQPSWLKIEDDITGGKKAFFFSTVAP
jgi:hypothetical protein